MMNRAIAKLIQTDQTHQIPAQLQTGKDVGMELMDQALPARDQGQGSRPGRRLQLRDRQERTVLEVRRGPQPAAAVRNAGVAGHRVAKIDEYLEEILKRDGSDLHFMAGDPPRIRQYGKLCQPARRAARGRLRARGDLRDHAAQGARPLRDARRHRLRLHARHDRALPRQRAAAAERHGRACSARSRRRRRRSSSSRCPRPCGTSARSRTG